MNLAAAIYDKLAVDGTLAGMLSVYGGGPAVFTTQPAPGDAVLPYIVTAGDVSHLPFDSKTTLGRDVMRDVRCYTAAEGSVVEVEAMAERVRALLHRQALTISGFIWIISDCSGPVAADERDAYGRVITLSLKAQEV